MKTRFKAVLLSILLLAAAPAHAKAPDVGQCLKQSVDKVALKTIVKNMTSQLKAQVTQTVTKYASVYAALAQAVANAENVADGLLDAAKAQIKDAYLDYKNTATFVSSYKAYKEGMEERVKSINNFKGIKQRIQNAVDPKRFIEGVKNTFQARIDVFKNSATELAASFDSMEQGLKALDEENLGRKATKEEIAAAKQNLKIINSQLIGQLQNSLLQQSNLKTTLQTTNATLDLLISATSTSQARQRLDAERNNPNSKSSREALQQAHESLQDVENGHRTLTQFRGNMTAMRGDFEANLLRMVEPNAKLVEALAKANDLMSKLSVLEAPLEIANQVLGMMGQLQSAQAFLGNFVASSEQMIQQYALMALSVPLSVFNSWDAAMTAELSQLVNDIASVASILTREMARLAQLQALFTQVLPAYIIAYLNFLNVNNLLIPAQLALAEFQSLIDLKAGGMIVMVALDQAFQIIQPVLKCIAPYMKYMVMATLITGGRLNIASFLSARSLNAMKRSSTCKRGVKVKGRCVIPKDRKVLRAQVEARNISRKVIESLKVGLNGENAERRLNQLLVDVRALSN